MPRVPTYTLPESPRAMARPPTTPVAQISALKPGGSLKLASGMSAAGVAVILPGTGASVELAYSPLRPCCHAGGGGAAGAAAAAGAGAAAAGAGGEVWQAASANALASMAILASIGSLLVLCSITRRAARRVASHYGHGPDA